MYSEDHSCGSESKWLGNLIVSECVDAALEDTNCHGYFMFSPAYYGTWGCRCCSDGGQDGVFDSNWDVWAYESMCPTTCPIIQT
jgi:hypothetical protein